MNTDAKLRQHFQELRSADAHRVPAFSRVARAPAVAFPWWRLAVGVAMLMTVAMPWMIHRRQPVANSQQWAAVSNWHATTDELLTVSSTPFGSTITTPTDSWIKNSTQTNKKETL